MHESMQDHIQDAIYQWVEEFSEDAVKLILETLIEACREQAGHCIVRTKPDTESAGWWEHLADDIKHVKHMAF